AYSRQLLQLLRTSAYTSDDVVVINSAPPVPIFFWQWALPFAVEKPFMDFPARIVVVPDWYCCPDLLPKREALLKETATATAGRVRRIDFNPATRRFEEH